jgi:hypothetical protein
MGWQKVILIVVIILISGCASKIVAVKNRNESMTMMQIYAQSAGDAQKDISKFIENNLKEQKTFGFVKPYIPVMREPVVRKVWIPDHKSQEDADVLIAGHWSYVMIEPPTWFIDEKQVDAKVPMIVPVSNTTNKKEVKEENYPYANLNPTDGKNI